MCCEGERELGVCVFISQMEIPEEKISGMDHLGKAEKESGFGANGGESETEGRGSSEGRG